MNTSRIFVARGGGYTGAHLHAHASDAPPGQPGDPGNDDAEYVTVGQLQKLIEKGVAEALQRAIDDDPELARALGRAAPKRNAAGMTVHAARSGRDAPLVPTAYRPKAVSAHHHRVGLRSKVAK